MPTTHEMSVTYGKEMCTVRIDDAHLAAPLVAPRKIEGPAGDPRAALVAALAAPVGRPKLREMVCGKKVALVISDEFRAGLHETILDVLFEEIVRGGPAKLTVLCATGTHDPALYAQNVRVWTERASQKHGLEYAFIGHNCDDPALIEIGATARGNRIFVEPAWLEADVRVFGHEGKHHYMAGYSSVAKQVLPGIASRATVAFNHKLALDDNAQAGQHPLHADPGRRVNPFAEDALEAFGLAVHRVHMSDGTLMTREAATFLLDVISDDNRVFWVEAGDPETVTRHMIDAADRQALITVPKSRYVVISPGGPPACTTLYGVQNCFDMALLGAIEEGGEALVIAPCNGRAGVAAEVKGLAPDMKSKTLFWDNLVRMRDWPLEKCLKEIDDHFELYLWKTWRVLRLFKRERVKIWLHSELDAKLLAQAGFGAAPDVQAWIDERAARNDGKFVVIDGGNKLLVRG